MSSSKPSSKASEARLPWIRAIQVDANMVCVQWVSMSDFDMMNLPDALRARVADMGLTDPTPIQAQAIPHAMNGRDVMGLAQTGTGKTAAFGIPLVARLIEEGKHAAPKTARGLILAPTRELAGQIAQVLRALTDMKVQIVVGGVSINPQIQRLSKGVDILVATPGRLLDLVDRRAVAIGPDWISGAGRSRSDAGPWVCA